MNKNTFRWDDAPLVRDIVINETSATLQIVEGELSRKGVYATLNLFNCRVRDDGTRVPLHSDRLLMNSDLARRRYANAVKEADPAFASPDLARELMQISVDLTARLAADATAGPPAAPPVDTVALWRDCEDLAKAADLLDRVVVAMVSRGLVGEVRNAKLLYLGATARLLEKPISVFVKGPSSSGKSHLIERVIEVLPLSACVNFTTISPRFLAYSNLDLRHKIVVIYEAGGMDDGIGAYVMRSLLSEGCLRIGTVDRGEGDTMEAREIHKEGPTALFTSTTKGALDGELETRALNLATNDGPEQSKAIMRGAARRYMGDQPEPLDLAPYHALQEWLEAAGERRVVIPFASQLAECVPTLAIRIRRDFGKLLTLITACAVLHQAQREHTEGGALLATLDDYRIVRELLEESFGAAQQDGLTPKQREAVIAVTVLQPEGSVGVSLGPVAAHLGIDKSAASRRLSNPVAQGYVRNLEERPRQPARFAPGEKLPEPVSSLPKPEDLVARGEIEL
jgi:hypothetical protein